MYSRILIATDGSELAGRGLEQGLALAKALGSEVAVLTVSEPWMPVGVDATGFAITDFSLSDEYRRAAEEVGKEILDKALARASAAGVPCEVAYIARSYPADAILDYAAANGVELIVMASHGRRGLGRVLLGSQTNEVLTRSAVPVLVVR
ncbi:MAG TPA: universal stress protein [Devosia sp.]|nr:universal stress protein [Devosia sp.]